MHAGDTVHVSAGVVHRASAVTDLVFTEVSSAPAGWREDIVRLAAHYGRTGATEL